jgi:2-iminoacetate synthase ThiH
MQLHVSAVQKEFPHGVDVLGVGLQSRFSNRMKRYHGTFKEHSKVMRAIKKPDSSIIEGERIYYNHIRPHSALNGNTRAQAARLELDLGANRWQGLIEKSSTRKRD